MGRAFRKGVLVGDEIAEMRWVARDDDGNTREVVVNATATRPARVTQHIVEVVKKLWWPLTFVLFRSADVVVVEDDDDAGGDLALTVARPHVLGGTPLYASAAAWGGAAPPDACDAPLFRFALADPFDGCAGTLLKAPVVEAAAATDDKGRVVLGRPRPEPAVDAAADAGLNGTIVVAQRGKCTFVDKARALARNGAAGVVVVNTDASVFSMPSGGANTDDVGVPVVMVDAEDGALLARALRWRPRQTVAGRLGAARACGPPPFIPPPRPETDEEVEAFPDLRGTATFQCGGSTFDAPFLAATFGDIFARAALVATVAAPKHLCSLQGVERRPASRRVPGLRAFHPRPPRAQASPARRRSSSAAAAAALGRRPPSPRSSAPGRSSSSTRTRPSRASTPTRASASRSRR